MKVLFDQNVPLNLRKCLPGHEVHSAANLGWEELRNGELLKSAEEQGYDVFVTGDQSLSYQQNLSNRTIAIVELTKNNWPSVEPQIVEIVNAIDNARPGTYTVIPCAYVHQSKLSRRG